MKVRLRFLYLLAITFSVAYVAQALQTRSYASTSSGSVLSYQSSSRLFDAPTGMPDPNEIYRQVNKTRQAAGLPPLVRDDALAKLATSRAQDMSRRAYYAHKNPDGIYYYDLLEQAGYDAEYNCENLDLEFTTQADVYVNSWLRSKSGHRECLLNTQTTNAGYAVATIANNSTDDIPSYVVVAIHSTQPTTAE